MATFSLGSAARSLLLGLCLAGLAGQAWAQQPNFRIRSTKQDGVQWVFLVDVAKYYGLVMNQFHEDLRLTGGDQEIDMTLGRRDAAINGIGVSLLYPPRLVNGTTLLAERDLSLILDPILRPWALPKQGLGRIVLDPGHGGKDTGAKDKTGTILEKDIALAIAKEAKSYLEGVGYKVLLTRSNDTFVELDERDKIARVFKADLFLSLHLNAADDRDATGLEIFTATPQGTPGTYDTRAESAAVPGNEFDRLNTRLAYDLQHSLLYVAGAADRGLRHSRFAVLRNPGCPAALAELGFMSNPRDVALLTNPAYRRRLAIGVANGIIIYHHALASAWERQTADARR